MAKQEPIENIDPVYKYVDEKVKVLKTEILKTQRVLAELRVRVMHNETAAYKETKKSSQQFVAELTTAINEIRISEDPLSIANKFTKTRWADLKELGIEAIHINR